MNTKSAKESKKEEEKAYLIPFAEFLESTPPTITAKIEDMASKEHVAYLFTPQIQLHCPSDSCNGTRFFRYSGQRILLGSEEFKKCFLTYLCSNCRKTFKTFSLEFYVAEDNHSGSCMKFGEYPVYGPPTPARLIKLIGPDRELFLQGRRCENQGLGIGAFTYYRRVVENQKERILEEVIKVAKKLNTAQDIVKTLETAKKEDQFSKAMVSVKDAIPQALLINGYNPLTLLHKALSKGIHGKTDEECFNDAHSIRVVLAELSDRLTQALKDEVEINSAISNLLK